MERALETLVRIDRAEYAGVAGERHVFLVGDLKRPTAAPFVRDRRVEVVVMRYAPGDDGQYHWHPDATEYQLVVEGEIGYVEVPVGTTHWFGPGDFVAIPAGQCVKRVVRGPAWGLTVKVPSSDAKIHCDGCSRDCLLRVAPRVP